MAVLRSSSSSFLGAVVLLLALPHTSWAFAPRAPPQSTTSKTTTSLSAAALIVQNKGGGHGELGYQLAQTLLQQSDKISSVTILQDEACNMAKQPFASYATDLPTVDVVTAPLGDASVTAEQLQSLLNGKSFDYVWDNASKNAQGAGKAVCDCALAWNVKLLVYVSSAGMYQPAADGPFPMPETTPVKPSAGQNLYDEYAQTLGLPLVSFRPQYIYGPKANKYDYIDWYFDRLVRQLPLPIPGDGTQLVSLTNAQDVASLLAAPLANEPAAVEQCVFNCGTDQLISYNDVAYLCADAAGIPREQVELVHYDADYLGKGEFPFRPSNFYVAPDTAKAVLGWPGPQHFLVADLPAYYEGYVARGGPTKEKSWVKDWEIAVGHTTTLPDDGGSVYDQYDPIPFDMSALEGQQP